LYSFTSGPLRKAGCERFGSIDVVEKLAVVMAEHRAAAPEFCSWIDERWNYFPLLVCDVKDSEKTLGLEFA
jgi:hypothetical protein